MALFGYPYLFQRSLLIAATLSVSMGAVKNAGASSLCSDMESLIAQAQSNFMNGAVSLLVAPEPIGAANRCFWARSLSGKNSHHCVWEFTYRDVTVHKAYDTLTHVFQSCFSGGLEIIQNGNVNHPDTYLQHEFQRDQIAISLSIKDKSALDKTYIFVGVSGQVSNR